MVHAEYDDDDDYTNPRKDSIVNSWLLLQLLYRINYINTKYKILTLIP